MQKRTLKVALLAVLAIVLVFGISTLALADQTWSDLPDTVTAKYGLTDNQVAGISEGYPGGLWKPYQPVTRAQFAKMAVAAFNIPLANPATASFTDVPKGSYYYQYIEGAKAAGAINGTSATAFSPNANTTRQQAIAIVARYIAKVQGYDLATMYTADELDLLLKHFGDVASISADLKTEVAFAFDMGLTTGDDFGNINPLANLTRIQAAAFLVRAQALVPPQLWIPAKIELVSADKTEGLIGQTFSATFEVTDAAGHPAIGVLVDFDTMMATNYYVGNVSPEAAVTNNYGQVTVNMLSVEPGTQRLSATVAGVGTIYTTRYWLVLDEVYNTLGSAAQNNAGVEHQWAARVVVFGPGPMSTSLSDWYNAIDTANAFDPTDIDVEDGIDANEWYTDTLHLTIEDWNLAFEKLLLANQFKPRTMAGVNVEWAIYDLPDNPKTILTNEAVVSVGNIINLDGTAITPAKTAVGKTDANGLSTIKVYSEKIGVTLTEAVADYPENPYPEELFNHMTFENQNWWHDMDWDDQPAANATQVKTWISHTIGVAAGPIAPAYQAPNVGEEKILTITLTDVYGNPVAGKAVEWFMQGVGFFQTDDAGDSSDPEVAGNNVDFDVTNAAGKATVFVKSYDSGEQVVHAKVRDKGTGGAEGTWTTYTAEVQWFDVDIATFDDITTQYGWSTPYVDTRQWVYLNEAWSANAVNSSHTFTLGVYGLKLEYDPSVDYRDGQTPFIDSDAAGSSYDGVFDAKDAAYFGGLLMLPWPQTAPLSWIKWFDDKLIQPFGYTADLTTGIPANCHWYPYDEDGSGIIEAVNSHGVDERGYGHIKVAGKWLQLSFEGAYTGYDYNDDAWAEMFSGIPGIYLPLAGKTVTFTKANEYAAGYSNLGALFDLADVLGVGTFTPATAVTDAAGKASVTVTATVKGPETIKAVVDWAGNPHNGPQLVSAYAKKNWVAGTVAAATDVTIEIWIDGVKVATNKAGELAVGDKAAWTIDPETGDLLLNSAHVEVHVKDAYGNDLPDYEVVYLLEDIDGWLGGSQNAAHTYVPFAYLADLDPDNDNLDAAGTHYDTNGPAPDSDEPMPASDPYAYIVGPGGTEAFFFNQWLGSEKPALDETGQPGLPTWYQRVPGIPFDAYYGDYDHVSYTYTWARYPWPVDPVVYFSPFDGVLEAGGAEFTDDIGLATDGAKAWTLDGYFRQWHPAELTNQTVPAHWGPVIPNLLTGSNIDIQFADDIRGAAAAGLHVESILRVMVYAPADGLVQEGQYLWSTQVHQVWQEPLPTKIVLTPSTDYAIAGGEQQTVIAQVLDQFGTPMPGVEVSFASLDEYGAQDYELEGDLSNLAGDAAPVTTDENGNASVVWSQDLGDWGVEKVVAFLDTILNADGPDADLLPNDATNGDLDTGELASNASLIQWIYVDGQGELGNLIGAESDLQKVMAYDGTDEWNGDTLYVWLNPGGNVAGSLGHFTYVTATGVTWSTTLHTWISGEGFFVSDASSSNTDEVVNWVVDYVDADL
jgi:protocatechuate 3,4-dioxygenase beta subunit